MTWEAHGKVKSISPGSIVTIRVYLWHQNK